MRHRILFAFSVFFCVMAARAEVIPGSSKPSENTSPIDLGNIDIGRIGAGDKRIGGGIDIGDKLIGGGADTPPPLESRPSPITATDPGAHISSPLPQDVHPGGYTVPNAYVPLTGSGGAPLPAASEIDTTDREQEEADTIFGYVFMTLMGIGAVGVLMLLFTRQTGRFALPRWGRRWR